MITYRKIEERDNSSLAKIVRDVLFEHKANKPGTVYYDPTTDDLFRLFKTPKSEYWVVEIDGVVKGGGGIYPTPNLPEGCCELVKLYLLADTRGKGVGKQLIEKCFTSAQNLGYTSMYLETMPELRNAVGLYESLGFKYLKGPLGESGHFGCDLWMLKQLDSIRF